MKYYKNIKAVADIEKGELPMTLEAKGSVLELLKSYSEIGVAGAIWRYFFKQVILFGADKVNSTRITRNINSFLFFQNSYESMIIKEVIFAFDSGCKRRLNKALTVAFGNRNVSRILRR